MIRGRQPACCLPCISCFLLASVWLAHRHARGRGRHVPWAWSWIWQPKEPFLFRSFVSKRRRSCASRPSSTRGCRVAQLSTARRTGSDVSDQAATAQAAAADSPVCSIRVIGPSPPVGSRRTQRRADNYRWGHFYSRRESGGRWRASDGRGRASAWGVTSEEKRAGAGLARHV